MGPALRGRRRGGGGQLLPVADARGRAARGLRGEPRGARRPQGHRRQPELHDHADRGGARPDPEAGGDRARGDVELPGGLGHRAEGGRGAARPGGGADPREGDPDAVRLSAPDRVQRAAAGRDLQGRRRLHDRGAQVHARDEQDPRPRRHRRVRHLRARAGVHGALGVGQRADARAALARRVPRAARLVSRVSP